MQSDDVPQRSRPRPQPAGDRLFTPGPLSTSESVKQAMLYDMGSRTTAFSDLTSWVLNAIQKIAGGRSLTAIPIQGSATFAVEAMLTCLLNSANTHLLLAVNGDYSRRMMEICRIHGLRITAMESDPLSPINLSQIDRALVRDNSITHVAAAHFETGVGVLNDLDGLISIAERHNVSVLVDAVSTFGAISINSASPAVQALAVSANKCLHSVPGVSFVIVRENALDSTASPRTLSLDLHAQHAELKRSGQWRFTPPVQVILALARAIEEFHSQGGVQARFARYRRLTDRLVHGFSQFGVAPLIPDAYRAPMITTFLLAPGTPFSGVTIVAALAERGLVTYPSRHQARASFRVGCMGELTEVDIDHLVCTVRDLIAK